MVKVAIMSAISHQDGDHETIWSRLACEKICFKLSFPRDHPSTSSILVHARFGYRHVPKRSYSFSTYRSCHYQNS